MEIVGYVAYASLVILAIAWTIGVRTDLNAGAEAILRAVYFVAGAIIIASFGLNMAHSLWVVPLGCFFSRIIAPTLVRMPVVSIPFLSMAAVFAHIARVGVPRHRIQEAQTAAMRANADECCGKNEHS